MRARWIVAVMVALGSLLCRAAPGLADAAAVRQEVEATAGKMQWLDPSWIVYDRDMPYPKTGSTMESAAMLQGLVHGKATAKETLPLLKHQDPKVRTLAIAMLAYREYPRHLDAIAQLWDDNAETIPRPEVLASSLSSFTIGGQAKAKEPPAARQTVHDIAKAIVAHHLMTTGDTSGDRWDKYWAKREAREYGLADYMVMWERATQGASPLPAGREQKVKAVVERMKALPVPDRFLAVMQVRRSAMSGAELLPGDAEVQDMAKELSREQRLKLVRGEPISEDPDARNGTDAARSFVLKHAAALLEAKDASMLLELERLARQGSQNWRSPMGSATPEYAIAAADLRPDAARSILRAALDRFVDYNNDYRRELAVALFRLGTDADLPYLTHQFYCMVPEPGSFPGSRVAMLQACQKVDDAKYQRLVFMVVYDLRLSGLGPPSVRQMMEDVERWTNWPVVGPEELRTANGHDESMRDGPFRPLVDWKDRLRRSMAALEKQNPGLLEVHWGLEFQSGL